MYTVLCINYTIFIYANIYWDRNYLKRKESVQHCKLCVCLYIMRVFIHMRNDKPFRSKLVSYKASTFEEKYICFLYKRVSYWRKLTVSVLQQWHTFIFDSVLIVVRARYIRLNAVWLRKIFRAKSDLNLILAPVRSPLRGFTVNKREFLQPMWCFVFGPLLYTTKNRTNTFKIIEDELVHSLQVAKYRMDYSVCIPSDQRWYIPWYLHSALVQLHWA